MCIFYTPTIIKHGIFYQVNFVRFANIKNDKTIINNCKSDNSNATNTRTQNCQMMTTITNNVLKFKIMIKTPRPTNHTFFTIITLSRINPFN